MTILLDEMEEAHDAEVASLEEAEERAAALSNESLAKLDAAWSLDLTNDGTFVIRHGEIECPQHIVSQLLLGRHSQIVDSLLG